jgi:hypothetical protein
MSYSKGVIAIPNVTGNISITVTTEAIQLVNLFDSSTSTYNARIKNIGLVATGENGNVVTAPIAIGNISTLAIQGVTLAKNNGSNFYVRIGLYTSSVGDNTDFIRYIDYASPTYSFDIASIKAQNPTATHLRFQIVLSSSSAISTTDTANLAIYGS